MMLCKSCGTKAIDFELVQTENSKRHYIKRAWTYRHRGYRTMYYCTITFIIAKSSGECIGIIDNGN